MIENLVSAFKESDVCNPQIKAIFSKYLSMLDFDKIDSNGLFLSGPEICHFEIKSISRESIILTFDFWRHQINIYLGEEKFHYADDVSVISENDLIKFGQELEIIFYSKILREIMKNRKGICEYKFTFIDKNETVIKTFRSSYGTNSYLNNENVIQYTYIPWLKA